MHVNSGGVGRGEKKDSSCKHFLYYYCINFCIIIFSFFLLLFSQLTSNWKKQLLTQTYSGSTKQTAVSGQEKIPFLEKKLPLLLKPQNCQRTVQLNKLWTELRNNSWSEGYTGYNTDNLFIGLFFCCGADVVVLIKPKSTVWGNNSEKPAYKKANSGLQNMDDTSLF